MNQHRLDKLAAFTDPLLGLSWGELGAQFSDRDDRLRIELGYPVGGMEAALIEALRIQLGAPELEIELGWQAPPGPGFESVGHLIAVASGKGGVGKSTTAVNLALALAASGARVGLLDADIYGPSQGLLLGIAAGRRPEVVDEKFFLPVPAYGLATMSMSYLTSERTPMVWRGPMASGALQQMLKQTRWGVLDYLLIDMPPGTGDIQLTLAQQAPVSGAVIVTTPQDLALLDARRGIEMFHKVDIPTLGIVENMSVHVCPNCGYESHPFGSGGGAGIAEQYGVPVLAELPLSMAIREQADSGRPTVVAEPEGDLAARYGRAARHMAARLWALSRGPSVAISMSDD